jgi:3-hydroxypropanoate dehydrogenase
MDMQFYDEPPVLFPHAPDARWRVNFACNLGYGDASALFPRSPRLSFDAACRVL